MIKIKAGHIDTAQLDEVQAALGEAFQARMEAELTKAFGAPPAIAQPTKSSMYETLKTSFASGQIRIDPDPLLQQQLASRWNWLPSLNNYFQRSAISFPAFPSLPTARTTTRKDGREQKTCGCGCCGYPHRAGSVTGCKLK